jgi:oligopeptide transport system substrate-binding protein
MNKKGNTENKNLNNISVLLQSIKKHKQGILKNNAQLTSMLESRENILRSLTDGGYSISANLETLKNETHNLFASIQIISEATEVALKALEEQKNDWEVRYSNLDIATKGFSKIIETIQESIESLSELGERIKKIENSIDKIHNISHLTRGVSRNAGIKAYHAGEKGKGFEVIARELSQLTKESLKITVKVPDMIAQFQNKTKEALDFVSLLSHNVEKVRKNSEKMKEKLKSSEQLLSQFKEASGIIYNSVRKQIEIKEKLGKEEEKIALLSTQSFVETSNITALEQSQSSLALLVNKFIANFEDIIESFRQKGNRDSNLIKTEINTNRLMDYIHRVSTLTSQIKETSRKSMKHFESQKRNVSEIVKIIDKNRMVKKDIMAKTDSLMNILNQVTVLFEETKALSEQIFDIINKMSGLVEKAENYLPSLEKEIEGVEETLNKLKKFSKRSRLLSLYAAIETARAFEYEKELEVIVNQIKDLSSQSSDSLKIIEESVAEVKISLGNVHNIFTITYGELINAKDDFKPMLKSFSELDRSAEKLKNLVEEMLTNLKKQTTLEQGIVSTKGTLSSKIEENISRNTKLAEEAEKTGSVVSSLLDELNRLHTSLKPYLKDIKQLEKNILTLRLSGDIIAIDPSITTDATSNRVSTNIFKGLVEQGMDSNVIPAIAERWSLSEDGLLWTFELRNDVKFHDGELLKAEDVKTTLKHILRGRHSYMFDMIKGAKSFTESKNKEIEGIKIISPHKLQIELSHPHIPFLRNLAVSCGGIIKETANGYIGAGPYKLKKWDKNDKIILESFNEYFGKKPFFDEIHFKVYRDNKEATKNFLDGELDVMRIPTIIDYEKLIQKKEKEEINIENFLIYDIYYIGINVRTHGPLQNKLVRQALNYAINREEYIEKIAKNRGTPAKGIFPPNFSTYNESLSGYSYNPEKAKSLLKQAGFPEGLPGKYQMDIRDSDIAMKGAEIIKSHCQAIGIELKINTISWEQLLERESTGKSLLFALGWSNDNGDPDSFLYPLFHSKNWGEKGNTTFYKNEAVDELLDEAAALTDHYKREEIYKKVEGIIVDDAPWIFLYHSKHSVAYQSHIRGYSKNPLGTERLEDVWRY